MCLPICVCAYCVHELVCVRMCECERVGLQMCVYELVCERVFVSECDNNVVGQK